MAALRRAIHVFPLHHTFLKHRICWPKWLLKPVSAASKRRRLTHETPVTAFECVVAITELASEILLHVDQQTLLASAQRVCRRWHQIIHSAPSLQRHLFLDIRRGNSTGPRVFNPLLVQLFPDFFETAANENPISEEAAITMIAYFYRSRPRTKAYDVLDLKGDAAIIQDRPTVPASPWAGEPNRVLRDGASWMRMHVTDPPTVRVGISSSSSGSKTEILRRVVGTTEIAGGLRMQDVYISVLQSSAPEEWLAAVVWPHYRTGTILVDECQSGVVSRDDWERRVNLEAEPMIYVCSPSSRQAELDDEMHLGIWSHWFFGRREMRMPWSNFVRDAERRRRREACQSEDNPVEYLNTDYDSEDE